MNSDKNMANNSTGHNSNKNPKKSCDRIPAVCNSNNPSGDKQTSNKNANEQTAGRSNEQTTGRSNEQTTGRSSEQTTGRSNEQTTGRSNERNFKGKGRQKIPEGSDNQALAGGSSSSSQSYCNRVTNRMEYQNNEVNGDIPVGLNQNFDSKWYTPNRPRNYTPGFERSVNQYLTSQLGDPERTPNGEYQKFGHLSTSAPTENFYESEEAQRHSVNSNNSTLNNSVPNKEEDDFERAPGLPVKRTPTTESFSESDVTTELSASNNLSLSEMRQITARAFGEYNLFSPFSSWNDDDDYIFKPKNSNKYKGTARPTANNLYSNISVSQKENLDIYKETASPPANNLYPSISVSQRENLDTYKETPGPPANNLYPRVSVSQRENVDRYQETPRPPTNNLYPSVSVSQRENVDRYQETPRPPTNNLYPSVSGSQRENVDRYQETPRHPANNLYSNTLVSKTENFDSYQGIPRHPTNNVYSSIPVLKTENFDNYQETPRHSVNNLYSNISTEDFDPRHLANNLYPSISAPKMENFDSYHESSRLSANNLYLSTSVPMMENFNGYQGTPRLPANNLYSSTSVPMMGNFNGYQETPRLSASNLYSNISTPENFNGYQETPRLPANNMYSSISVPKTENLNGYQETPRVDTNNLYSNISVPMIGNCNGYQETPRLPANNLYANISVPMTENFNGYQETPRLPANNMYSGISVPKTGNFNGYQETSKFPANNLYSNISVPKMENCNRFDEVPRLPANSNKSGMGQVSVHADSEPPIYKLFEPSELYNYHSFETDDSTKAFAFRSYLGRDNSRSEQDDEKNYGMLTFPDTNCSNNAPHLQSHLMHCMPYNESLGGIDMKPNNPQSNYGHTEVQAYQAPQGQLRHSQGNDCTSWLDESKTRLLLVQLNREKEARYRLAIQNASNISAVAGNYVGAGVVGNIPNGNNSDINMGVHNATFNNSAVIRNYVGGGVVGSIPAGQNAGVGNFDMQNAGGNFDMQNAGVGNFDMNMDMHYAKLLSDGVIKLIL